MCNLYHYLVATAFENKKFMKKRQQKANVTFVICNIRYAPLYECIKTKMNLVWANIFKVFV